MTPLDLIGALKPRKLKVHDSVKSCLLLRFYCHISGIHSNLGAPPQLNYHLLYSVHLATACTAFNISVCQ